MSEAVRGCSALRVTQTQGACGRSTGPACLTGSPWPVPRCRGEVTVPSSCSP